MGRNGGVAAARVEGVDVGGLRLPANEVLLVVGPDRGEQDVILVQGLP